MAEKKKVIVIEEKSIDLENESWKISKIKIVKIKNAGNQRSQVKIGAVIAKKKRWIKKETRRVKAGKTL